MTTRTVAVQAKSLFASKTFWTNAVVGIIAIIGEVQAILPAFADILVLPASATRWLLLIAAVLNIALRRLTNQPVRATNAEQKAVSVPAATAN